MAGKTVKPPEQVRERFNKDPSRHYVRVEKPSQKWDSDTLDNLQDEVDGTGELAYRVEADGAASDEERKKAGGSRWMLLSCPKEHMDEKLRRSADESRAQSGATKPDSDDEFERIKRTPAISLDSLRDHSTT